MRIPENFAREIVRREGTTGQEWLASLPALARRCCRDWQLTIDGAPMHGHVAVVLPVRRANGAPAMLKLTWLDAETRDEPVALSTWHGRGSVLLLEKAPGALLLERLDPMRTLTSEPIADAVETAAQLLRRLAVPAPPAIRTLRAEAARFAEVLPRRWARLGKPFPRRLLDEAVELCGALDPASLLVNEDLHYENVLAGTREPWLVIDPKPIAGDLEYGVIPLLWNRMYESTLDWRGAAIIDGAGLDAERTRAWTLVRGVHNWLWALDSGGFPDSARLAEITWWAAGRNPG